MSRLSVAAGLLLLASWPSHAAELKKETLDAWDRYLASANAEMVERAHGKFLWVDESGDRLRQVRAGEVVVVPVHAPKAVPGGLIHHWMGAAFIRGAHLEDVMSVVRNYNRYTDFYKPSVIDAKTLSQKAAEDRFSVVVVDPAMFRRRALDSDYQSRFVELDGKKWYSVAETTRVQEVSGEERIPDGEGSGYIWRLASISRYEERDGGVYIETEAMALSRGIPMALHWVVDPIVRRVSKASLETSLGQTRDATGGVVRTEAALSARRLATVRARAQ